MSEKTKRETWREWLGQVESLPDPPMLTRTEVIATIERLGISPPVDERILRYWETERLIPRPTLAYVDHATRARYPWWVVDLVAQIRLYQTRGFTIDQLRDRMPIEARWLTLHEPRPTEPFPGIDALFRSDPTQITLEHMEAELAQLRGQTYVMPPVEPHGPPFREAPVTDFLFAGDIVDALSRLAQLVGEDYGVFATSAEVRLLAPNGNSVEYRFALKPEPPWPAPAVDSSE